MTTTPLGGGTATAPVPPSRSKADNDVNFYRLNDNNNDDRSYGRYYEPNNDDSVIIPEHAVAYDGVVRRAILRATEAAVVGVAKILTMMDNARGGGGGAWLPPCERSISGGGRGGYSKGTMGWTTMRRWPPQPQKKMTVGIISPT
jgi:hypothetical protein